MDITNKKTHFDQLKMLNPPIFIIVSLDRKLYKVVQQDVIFCSSPQTFDPFMIDICLALNYGATLIMANNSLRCDAAMLFQVLFSSTQNEVTIMSTTPSLFMRWSSADKLNQIFLSKLRILAFGGEPFPSTSTMSKWTNWEKNSTRIFNLYGLTEMSCWASAYEITQDDIFANRKIPIGQPLDEHTSFQVNFDNELLLKSKVRKCFHSQLTSAQVIDNEFEFNLHTGDLVEANDASQLYFVGRSNSLIKFYGRKINLAEIETHARNVDGVKGAICLHDDKSNSIVLFVKVENNDESIKRQINKSIHASDIRLKIHCVPEFPLTAHGKINRIGLLNAVPNTVAKSVQLTFQEILNESLATEISFTTELSQSAEREKMPKRDIDSSFIHLGGTSLKAIQIVDELERIYTQTMPQLLPMLLDDRVSIREIVCILNRSVVSTENQFNDTNSVDQTIIRIVPRWQIDMKKCIDATPTVCKLKDDSVIVSIGSHSKLLYNVCVKSGNVISKLELPDRIESQVLQMGDFGIVGCYDGFLYCFDIHSGTIKWKFNSGAMIKCRTLSVNSTVIFGNYNESNNLWCLEADNGNMIWCQRIGNKSIYANPINLDDTNCLVCCLDGTVASINSTSSEIRWIFNAKAPVFATPSVFKNRLHDIQIILAVVDGNIYLLNSDGISIWNHQIDGNLFSSVECFPTENSRNFVFGSQNHYLYGFQIESSFSCKKMWKHKTSASIRSTPVFVQKGSNYYVIIFASDGLVYVVNCNIGQVVKKCRIDGQVFSSPVMHEQSLFVGSRNNYFYCINLTDLI